MRNLVIFVEAWFCTIIPVHLYGWKVGLLVASGLTSLLHIVKLLMDITHHLGAEDA